MPREPLRFPPDDIGEWHQIPVPFRWITTHRFQTQQAAQQSKNSDIFRWLREETTGPYYVKSHVTMMGHQPVNVYCFRESTDAVMFSMLWS